MGCRLAGESPAVIPPSSSGSHSLRGGVYKFFFLNALFRLLLHKFFGLTTPNTPGRLLLMIGPSHLKFNPILDAENNCIGNLVMGHCPIKCLLLDFRYRGCMKLEHFHNIHYVRDIHIPYRYFTPQLIYLVVLRVGGDLVKEHFTEMHQPLVTQMQQLDKTTPCNLLSNGLVEQSH